MYIYFCLLDCLQFAPALLSEQISMHVSLGNVSVVAFRSLTFRIGDLW